MQSGSTNSRWPIAVLISAFLVAILGIQAFAGSGINTSEAGDSSSMKFKQLTPEEERVIIHKGTERPFTGKYYNFNEDGTYTCKRCGAVLFKSNDKFDAGCGWPSFDDAVPGAIKRIPDPDGQRTEITCGRCGAHLGHVFEGEGFTDKNVRYCVNSVSLDFTAADAPPDTLQHAYFAGGCFWGTEYYLKAADGVVSATVGYMGGTKADPTYKEVCYEQTGHAETVEVTFDPEKTDYEKLARLFFEIHDPTQVDRQGPDIGDQYRSEIFYVDHNQEMIAEKLISILKDKGYKVATKLAPASEFWKAEDYHQDYYEKTGKQPYCHAYTKRF